MPDPSDQNRSLEEQIAGLRERMAVVKGEYGSVHVQCGPDNPIVQAGVTAIDRVWLHVEEGVRLLDWKDPAAEDIEVKGSLVLVQARCAFADKKGRCTADPAFGGDGGGDFWEDGLDEF